MRHGRLETIRHEDGKFHIRLVAANGRVLMHSEELTGRQVKRAKAAIYQAMLGNARAKARGCDCPACQRESTAV